MQQVEIVEYQPRWPAEYAEIAGRLRRSTSSNVVRIDHIGSTSIAELAAKDVIDIQVTVRDLTNPEHIEGYLSIKDPVMDLIYQAAESWAALTDWKPDSNFL